ncbi:acyl-homoserine-lactone synthase [Chelativorans sp. AA-79]|uniref:acyl-homoserine-lactone synthase n=1 Tax=Chelativorans sp. AA-79 TaxID=3028735 RepID=UPI0023F83AC6|nr:acyl-homoserine-lactone synthase [Chelativorans sp. AA-79]WEX07519.1 acyl-homoserine-lactone synthase [Chelativorans sp. AA-79]
MFTTIEPAHYGQRKNIVGEMFRLRKQVFHDMLEWDVPIQGEHERDCYDDLGPVYLVWCDPEWTTLYASLRLMPTTGPTLLRDVFRNTIPDIAALSSPSIWEATRSCVHAANLARDFPGVVPGTAFGLLLLATVECGLSYGIETIVANYEPRLKRVYKRAGASFDELGRADGFGKRPVCCGAFEISRHVAATMRRRLGIYEHIFSRPYPVPQPIAA